MMSNFRGDGGSKIVKNCQTSFMDDPLSFNFYEIIDQGFFLNDNSSI